MSQDRNDTNVGPFLDDVVTVVVVVGSGERSDRDLHQIPVRCGGGGTRLHVREADAGEQDPAMVWCGGEDSDAGVDSLDEVVVVDEDEDGGAGSDLCEGWRQTVPMEVVARSFLFSFSLKMKKEEKKKERSCLFFKRPILKYLVQVTTKGVCL